MGKKRKKAKVFQLNRTMSLSKYIKLNARKLPIYKCYITEHYKKTSTSFAYVFREKKNGDLVCGTYLIDLWCQGLIDSKYSEHKSYEKSEVLEHILNMKDLKLIEIDPNTLFNIIYGGIEYAEDLGFEPPKSFEITEYILDAADSIEFIDIKFGLNGRPAVFANIDNNFDQICAVLNKSVGRNGYDIIDDEDEERFGDDFFTGDVSKRLGSPYAYGAYLKYQHRLYLIDLIFMGDFDAAKVHLKNPTGFLVLIKKKLTELNQELLDLDLVDEEKELYLCVLEKYIMFLGIDFILDTTFIDSFKIITDEEEEIKDGKDIIDQLKLIEIDESEDFELEEEEEEFLPDNYDSLTLEEKLKYFENYFEETATSILSDDFEESIFSDPPENAMEIFINYTLLHTHGLHKIQIILFHYFNMNNLDSTNPAHIRDFNNAFHLFKNEGTQLNEIEIHLFHHLARHEEVFGKFDIEQALDYKPQP